MTRIAAALRHKVRVLQNLENLERRKTQCSGPTPPREPESLSEAPRRTGIEISKCMGNSNIFLQRSRSGPEPPHPPPPPPRRPTPIQQPGTTASVTSHRRLAQAGRAPTALYAARTGTHALARTDNRHSTFHAYNRWLLRPGPVARRGSCDGNLKL